MSKRRAALAIAEVKIIEPQPAKKFCSYCRSYHRGSAFLGSRFRADGLTDKCFAAIRKIAERDRLAREKRRAKLDSTARSARPQTGTGHDG
jgi:hypothetical protein